MAETDTAEVDAEIEEWRKSAKGPYGIAKITSNDSPTEKAIYGDEVQGEKPNVGETFRCIILRKGSTWRIAQLIIGGIPENIISIQGIVHAASFERGQRFWTIRCTPVPDKPPITVRLYEKLLQQAQIWDIDVGTDVIFDAKRESSGYIVSALHAC